MKFSSAPNASVQQVPKSPISRSMSAFSVAPFFQRLCQPPGQGQQNGK